MFIIFNTTKILFYFIVFYKYIFLKNKQYLNCRTNLISKLVKCIDSKFVLGTAIAKA
ncbi:hypothetical protein OTEC02_17700 [Acinetobacter lactucae]|nr:hypothetical protein OTEC02_17700 [Acinetobacter lactucae]